MRTKARIAAVLTSGLMMLGLSIGPAAAQPVVTGGLVNVTIVDLVDIEDSPILSENQVGIGVAAVLVANVCPNLAVQDVVILGVQANQTDTDQTAECDAEGGPAEVLIEQAQ